MSDMLTNSESRVLRPIASAAQPGGDVPPPGLGTPRVSEPRKPGDPLPAAVAHQQRIAAQRMQPCCICRGMAVDEKLPPNYIALVCAPHREARRQAQREARAARHPVAAKLGTTERSGRSYDRSAPNHEKPCTHCEKPRAKHGSYCTEHKTQYARERRRGMAPPLVEAARTIAAPRAADVIAARRAARAKAVPEILNTDLLEPPTKEPQMAAKTSEKCTHCNRAKLPSGPYCSVHKRQKNDEYLARKAQGATRARANPRDLPPLSAGAKRIAEKPTKQVIGTCAKCNKPRGKNAYCKEHNAERLRESRKVKAGDVVSAPMGPGVVQPSLTVAEPGLIGCDVIYGKADTSTAEETPLLHGFKWAEEPKQESFNLGDCVRVKGTNSTVGLCLGLRREKGEVQARVRFDGFGAGFGEAWMRIDELEKCEAPPASEPDEEDDFTPSLRLERLIAAARHAIKYLMGTSYFSTNQEAKTVVLELFDAVAVAP